MLCQGILYSQLHDESLSEALKQRKSTPEELLTAAGLAESMAEIEENYLKEQEEAKKAKGVEEAEVAETLVAELPEPDANPMETMGSIMEMARLAKPLNGPGKDRLIGYQRHVQTLVKTHVMLLDESLPEAVLSQRIATSGAGELRGDGSRGKYVIVVYDTKVSGEAASAPQYHHPAWRQQHHKKMMRAVMNSRTESAEELHPGDLYLFFNGGKQAADSAMGSNFAGDNNVKHEKRQSYVMYTEESMTSDRTSITRQRR